MKKTLVFVLVSLTILGLAGCQSLTEILKDKPVQNDQVTMTGEIEYTQTLLALAPIFAKALGQHPELKKVIYNEVGTMFDSDYDVLYDKVAYIPSETGLTLEQALIEQDPNSISMIKSIPNFNIAIPANYDKWLGYTGLLYVLPLRYDINDMDVMEMPGYDENGGVVPFLMDKAPEFPVLVIGINERVNLIGKMVEPIEILPEEPITALVFHNEKQRSIRLNHNLEPWPWGLPEVYGLYAVGNNYIGLKEYFNFRQPWWYRHVFNSPLFTYEDRANTRYYKHRLMEEDFSTNVNYTLRGSYVYSGITYYINHTFWVCSYDDVFGECMPYFYHTNPQTYSLGNYFGIPLAYVEMAY